MTVKMKSFEILEGKYVLIRWGEKYTVHRVKSIDWNGTFVTDRKFNAGTQTWVKPLQTKWGNASAIALIDTKDEAEFVGEQIDSLLGIFQDEMKVAREKLQFGIALLGDHT